MVAEIQVRPSISDLTLERLRALVKQVSWENDPRRVRALFDQIRKILRLQMAEAEQRIKSFGKPTIR